MKIIYGRAGSGKSEYIYNKIKEGLLNTSSPFDSYSQKVYIITPEQFSFTAEKRLIDSLGNGATTSVEVLSFERMAYRVINEMLDKNIIQVGKPEKAMIIYDAINKNKKELSFLGKSLENVDTVITQITEFKKHNINVEMLQKQVNQTESQYLKAKLNDMLILYKELENKLSDEYVDENDLLTILEENIEKSHLFDNAIFYLDEFAGFTKQEYSIIRKLDNIASEVYITVCTDSLSVIKSPDADVFYDNKQNVQTLCEIGELDKSKQVKLDTGYRFKNEELKHLEKNVFDIPYKIYKKENKNIKLYLAENPYNEIEYVASKILKLVRDDKYRYKDIAVICNNLETYSSLCKAIFEEYNVPVFIDDKKDITQNIIIKYVMGILEIFTKNWSYDSVFNYLKTGIVEIENLYELENYCLKWGIQGRRFYENKWDYDENNYENLQGKIINPLLDLKKDIEKEKTAKLISKKIYEYIQENLSNNLSIMTIPENVEAYNLIVDVLNNIAQLFDDRKMSFDYYSKILKMGLSEKKLGQIPQTQDKVVVGDVNRSKTHKIKAMFIIGVNDGNFPSIHGSEGFFNDKDRANLKQQNFEIAKGTREKSYEENFNIYKAFTTAENKLFISYSASDSDGKALRKSLFISKLKRIFPKLVEEDKIQEEVLTKNVTFSMLLNNLENPEWQEVFKWFDNNEHDKLTGALKGLKYSNEPTKISQENIEKLYGKNLKTSISRLESYSACPFSYYLKYGLKLSEKEKLDIKPIDTGTFMHEVIDSFFKSVKENNINIREIEDSQIEKIVSEIVEEKTNFTKKFMLTAKYRTLTQRLKRVVTISIKYIVISLKESQFNVYETEAEFDTRGDSKYQPIEMQLENGKKVSIIGKIDRIDIAKLPNGKYIRIIDYKSSTKDIDLNKVIAGLQLQLITYVDAVCENENTIPAGALYFTLLEPKIAQRNLSKEEIEQMLKENYKMNGIILANVDIIKAMDTELESGKSDKIPVTLNANGEINNSRSRTVTKDEFEKLQKYTNAIIKQISNEILEGNISLNPYYSKKEKNTPCQWCSYKSICQFNSKYKNNNYRIIENKKRQDILDSLK